MRFPDDLCFQGIDGSECEAFVLNVKKQARAEGKLRDNDWIVDLVSCSMAGKALRWYEDLDPGVQEDWNLFRKAMLKEWPGTAHQAKAAG